MASLIGLITVFFPVWGKSRGRSAGSERRAWFVVWNGAEMWRYN